MKEITDNFGNTIRIGDFVFVARGKLNIIRCKVSKITKKGVWLNERDWANINAVVKDHTQELDYLHSRDEELSRLEANGVDNWEGYEE